MNDAPEHPGRAFQRDVLEARNIQLTKAAKALSIHSRYLDDIINGHLRISTKMAVRFELAGWGSAEEWCCKQHAYDEWADLQKIKALRQMVKIRGLDPPKPKGVA